MGCDGALRPGGIGRIPAVETATKGCCASRREAAPAGVPDPDKECCASACCVDAGAATGSKVPALPVPPSERVASDWVVAWRVWLVMADLKDRSVARPAGAADVCLVETVPVFVRDCVFLI